MFPKKFRQAAQSTNRVVRLLRFFHVIFSHTLLIVTQVFFYKQAVITKAPVNSGISSSLSKIIKA